VWGTKEIEYLNTLQLLSSKPVVYLVNLTEKDYARKKNKWLNKIAEWVFAKSKDPIIPFSGALEQAVVDMPEDEAEAHCKELGATSALPKIIKTGFTALSLIYFFTAGPDEVKCWTIRKSYKAPQAAGTIHTDFERGFICAEVCPASQHACVCVCVCVCVCFVCVYVCVWVDVWMEKEKSTCKN
jgi:obg-like ATPase 1